MYKNFEEIMKAAKSSGPYNLCVAAAEDKEVLKAVKLASDMGIVQPILIGDSDKIRAYCKDIDLNDYRLHAASSPEDAAGEAVKLVMNGTGDILMKGLVNTSVYMRAILNKEAGMRTDKLLSVLAVYEVPGYHKLIYATDSGINAAPDLSQKKDILNNALGAIKSMGITMPKVAALAANELVNPKIQATVDAKGLVDAVASGEIDSCIIEGPMAFDVVFSKYAAEHKGIDSQVSGDVDLLVFPNIETGNVLGKSWLHFNKAKWAGIVLGAKKPVILSSRSDTAQIKLNAIALACLSSKEA
ncbi:phosphate butyryltransferase [Acidaminobacter sp. JC074]|uniref:phosphate acyltransferase n=1 Tax=Acidaminobacter sp. JC074 TaxID=2530199 RepID=UPI001F0E0B75|nr:phosphate acyltransferase [Acidaminobacter sp. JC074]MCH4886431.1 phosphate butyryltransferase [Acidaminobacter sp. JC074]